MGKQFVGIFSISVELRADCAGVEGPRDSGKESVY